MSNICRYGTWYYLWCGLLVVSLLCFWALHNLFYTLFLCPSLPPSLFFLLPLSFLLSPPLPKHTHTHTHTRTFADYVTDKDIEVVSKNLGTSWVELGQTLGFSGPELESFSLRVKAVHSKAGERMLREWQTLHRHNATFFALLGALEIIQRRDIADSLVAARMAGEGIAVWFMQFSE